MKHLNLIKLIIGILLVAFGLFLGYRLLMETSGQSIITLSIAFTGTGNATATYTPLYAAICIYSGAYLISKIQQNTE